MEASASISMFTGSTLGVESADRLRRIVSVTEFTHCFVLFTFYYIEVKERDSVRKFKKELMEANYDTKSEVA